MGKDTVTITPPEGFVLEEPVAPPDGFVLEDIPGVRDIRQQTPTWNKPFDDLMTGVLEIQELPGWPLIGLLDKDIAAKTSSAMYYHYEKGMPSDAAYDLVDALGTLQFGRTLPPETLWGRIKQNHANGKAFTQLGELGTQVSGDVWSDPQAFDKNLAQVNKLLGQITDDWLLEERSFWERIITGPAEQIPQQMQMLKSAGKYGMVGAIVSGLVGTYFGGPVVGATAFKAVGVAGATYGAFDKMRKLEGGQAFVELMLTKDKYGNRMDPKVASAAANIIGTFNGGVEVAEFATLLSAFGIGTKIFEHAAYRTASKMVAEGTLKHLAVKYMAKYSYLMSAEQAQEFVQESSNIYVGMLAQEINDQMKGTKFEQITGEKIKERYLEIVKKTFYATAGIVGAGVGTSFVYESITGEKAPMQTVAPKQPQAIAPPGIEKVAEKPAVEVLEAAKPEDVVSDEEYAAIEARIKAGQKTPSVAQGVETPPGAEIPLGIKRPPVIDTSLQELSEDNFQDVRERARKDVDKLEREVFAEDVLTTVSEAKLADSSFTQKLADAQDRYKAVENEEYRRRVESWSDPADFADELMKLQLTYETDKVKALLLIQSAKKQGLEKQVLAALNEKGGRSADWRYLVEAQIEDLKGFAEEIGKIPDLAKQLPSGAIAAEKVPAKTEEFKYANLDPKQEITIETEDGPQKMTVEEAVYTIDDIEGSSAYIGEEGVGDQTEAIEEVQSIRKELDKLVPTPPGEIAAEKTVTEGAGEKKTVANMTTSELEAELAQFDAKIQAEKKRLDEIAPQRQIFGGADIENLSEADAVRFLDVHGELGRRTGVSAAEAKKRVEAKRAKRLAEGAGEKQPWEMTSDKLIALGKEKAYKLLGTNAVNPREFAPNLGADWTWQDAVRIAHQGQAQIRANGKQSVGRVVLEEYKGENWAAAALAKIEKPEAIGTFEKNVKDSFGNWQRKTVEVLTIGEPYNVRGKVTGSNWAVDYETPSTLGKTGRQTNTEYFGTKAEAQQWIKEAKIEKPEKPAAKVVTKTKEQIAKVVKSHKVDILPHKDELVTQIETALEQAPEKGGEGIVHFEIDGGVNIINNKKALGEFLERVKATRPETWPVKKGKVGLKSVKYQTADALFEELKEAVDSKKPTGSLLAIIRRLEGAIPTNEQQILTDLVNNYSKWNPDSQKQIWETASIFQARQQKRIAPDTGKLPGGRQAGGTILLSPQEWADAIRAGMYHIQHGAKTIADWSAKMIALYGDDIKVDLPAIWDEIHGVKKVEEKPPEKPIVAAGKPAGKGWEKIAKMFPGLASAQGISVPTTEQKEAQGKQHQRIRAIKETKGLTEKLFKELKRAVTTSGKAISMTRMTQEELDAFEKKVKAARPKIVAGKKVLSVKTERQIQTLKDNLTRKLQMTEDAWQDILDREVQGREPKYIDAGHFITQTEARDVLKRMHNVASMLKVVQPYEDAIGKNSEIAELVGNIDQQIEDKYHPDPISLESMRYYAQQSELKTGAPIFRVFQALTDAHAENRRTQNAELKTLEVAVGEEAFAKIASDEKALKRISDYIDSKSHLEDKPEIPADITEDETKIAQAIEKIFEKRQIQSRVGKFFNYYYYDQPIAESEQYKKEIKKAIDIYDTQGEEELIEYLKTQEWGIKHSGYDPTESLIRKIRIYDPKPATVGKSHIQISLAVEYHPQERNIFQRLASYMRQMDTLVNMSPLINSLVQLYQDNAEKFTDWKTIENNVALYLQELKGYNQPRNWIEKWTRRIWAQTAQTVLENSISIFSYNLIEETALGTDKSTIFDPRNKALSPEREAYRETYCQQQQAMLEQFFMVNEKALFFLEPLNRLARRISLTAHSDVISRSLAFWGKINQVDRALEAKTTKEMMDDAKLQDMSLLEQRQSLAILAKDGPEAMAQYVARVYTDTTHALYERSQRSPAEMGQGQALANLMLFPRMYTERLVRAGVKVLGKDIDAITRYRAAKLIVSTVLGGALLGMLLAKVSGRRDNPYNPLNILKWRFGGLYFAAVDALNDLYIKTIQAFEGDEKQRERALNDWPAALTKVPEMFVPFYAMTIRGLEKGVGIKYLDRYALRSIREMMDKDYKKNPKTYEFNKEGIINVARYILQGRSVDTEEKTNAPTGIK